MLLLPFLLEYEQSTVSHSTYTIICIIFLYKMTIMPCLFKTEKKTKVNRTVQLIINQTKRPKMPNYYFLINTFKVIPFWCHWWKVRLFGYFTINRIWMSRKLSIFRNYRKKFSFSLYMRCLLRVNRLSSFRDAGFHSSLSFVTVYSWVPKWES